MDSIPAMNKALYDTLKLMMPSLPDHARKLTLTLEYGKPPLVEVEYLPSVDGQVQMPVEFKTDAYVMLPLNADGSTDITCLGDMERQYAESQDAANQQEVIATLRRIEGHLTAPLPTVNAVPGE